MIIIKFPYNACFDWLKERALLENRARVDDGKLVFKFWLRNFDKFAPMEASYLSVVNMAHRDHC